MQDRFRRVAGRYGAAARRIYCARHTYRDRRAPRRPAVLDLFACHRRRGGLARDQDNVRGFRPALGWGCFLSNQSAQWRADRQSNGAASTCRAGGQDQRRTHGAQRRALLRQLREPHRDRADRRRMTHPIRIIDTGLSPARWNVAMTAALAELHEKAEIPDTLRFHRYPRCVLLGRSQDADRAANLAYCRSEGMDIARRVTGGGAVFMCPELLAWDVVVDRAAWAAPLEAITRHVGEGIAA